MDSYQAYPRQRYNCKRDSKERINTRDQPFTLHVLVHEGCGKEFTALFSQLHGGAVDTCRKVYRDAIVNPGASNIHSIRTFNENGIRVLIENAHLTA